MRSSVIIFVIFGACCQSLPTKPPVTEKNCGYQSCHPTKEGYINVHIVPHTHDDVGWLKTLDQYYYGSKTRIQRAGVQYILDSMVDALKKNNNRRFIYVETAYFWKWWIKQHDTVKALVRRFVNTGQLEFIGGGWSMNDEAVTNYQSIIDQMTWGFRKLNDSFGECGRPKIGWQIDPFGHSREMASIFAQLGFDGALLGRIDYQDKDFRLKTKSAEMVWRASDSLGPESEIFTGVMFNTYSPPKGFCFDILCNDEPIIDDKKSPDYNVDKRVDDFFAHITEMTKGYATNNVIVTMGEDFNYQDAHVWFKNLDKLIYYANERQQNGSKYHLLYSTPSCYIKSVHDAGKGKKWLVKRDDFFPYASDPHAFWTGFFTSRPTIKRFEREGNNFLQICKQLYSLTDLGPEDRVDLNVMREAMGVMQHHDAITGTEKEHVAHDYSRILSKGFEECEFITATAMSKIVTSKEQLQEDPIPAIHFTSCPLLNVSQCEFTETRNSFVVTVYNSLSRSVRHFVRLPVLGNKYRVYDPEGNQIETQMISIAMPIRSIPGRNSKADLELIFEATDVPPFGFKSYFVEKLDTPNIDKVNDYVDGNAGFLLDPDTGLVTRIVINNQQLDLQQEFLYYEGFVGDNKQYSNRSSGAYIFRPIGEAVPVSKSAKIQIYRGPLVTEVHQQFNEWISQIIRVYAGESFIEFDWLVGPIPLSGHNGKEIITRYKTPLSSKSILYTDSNGRETLKRVRNSRPTWKLNLKEPIAGNYYPITSKIAINDGIRELAILTDRAEGGASLKDGEIELMLHRLCTHDDAFGVGEPLMEEAFDRGLVARGSHYLLFGKITTDNAQSIFVQERKLVQNRLHLPWTFLSSTNGLSYEEYKRKYSMKFSGLTRNLPDNIQILTLEPWKGSSFLLRLEHIFEKEEDASLSKPVTVDLKDLFSPFQITSLSETTLGANQWLEDNERLHFETGEYLEDIFNDSSLDLDEKQLDEHINVKRATVITAPDVTENMEITLNPMQIRTFIVYVNSFM